MNISEHNHMNLLKAAEYADFILFLEEKLGRDKLDELFKEFYEK